MANHLKLSFYCYWITIESSSVEESNLVAGGSANLGFWRTPSLDDWGDFLYGGMAGQLIGMCDRDSSIDLDTALDRVWAMGENDRKLFKKECGVDDLERLARDVRTIRPYFASGFRVLSAELKKQRFLYCGEAELIIYERLQMRPHFMEILEKYRRTRKDAIPTEVNNFKEKHPNTPWR